MLKNQFTGTFQIDNLFQAQVPALRIVSAQHHTPEISGAFKDLISGRDKKQPSEQDGEQSEGMASYATGLAASNWLPSQAFPKLDRLAA